MKRSFNVLTKLGIACIALVFSGCGDGTEMADAKNKVPVVAPQGQAVTNFEELAELPSEELEQFDIARMNLLCAQGLPGAESLNVEQCLKTLDQWALIAQDTEQKYLYQFFQKPAKYDHSIAKFKAVNLALTLKNDLGCGYNQRLVDSGAMTDLRSTRFFRDSRDLFIHGFTEQKAGSCSSLPVLMVAVGRRCGYPLYLVSCKGHLFCRWDDGKERFNIEVAVQGVDSKPDSYYRNWPHRSSKEEVASEGFLKNLAPKEELALFSQIRGACLQENGRFEEARNAYEVALSGFPDSVMIRQYINRIEGK